MMPYDQHCQISQCNICKIQSSGNKPYCGLPGLLFNGRRIPKLLSGSAQLWAAFSPPARPEAIPLELYPATNELLHETPPNPIIHARKTIKHVKRLSVEFKETVDVDSKPQFGDELPDLIKSVSNPTTPISALTLQFPELQDDSASEDCANQVSRQFTHAMKPESIGSPCKEAAPISNEERQSLREHARLQGRAVPGDGKSQQTVTRSEAGRSQHNDPRLPKGSISRQDSFEDMDNFEAIDIRAHGVHRSISNEGRTKARKYSQADSGVGSEESTGSQDRSFDSPKVPGRKLSTQMSRIGLNTKDIVEEQKDMCDHGQAQHNSEEDHLEIAKDAIGGKQVTLQIKTDPNSIPSLPESSICPINSIGADVSVTEGASLTGSTSTEQIPPSYSGPDSSYMTDGAMGSPPPCGTEETGVLFVPDFKLMMSDDEDMDVKSQTSSEESYGVLPKKPRYDPDEGAMQNMTLRGHVLNVQVPQTHVQPQDFPTHFSVKSPSPIQLCASTPNVQPMLSSFPPVPHSPIHGANDIEPAPPPRQYTQTLPDDLSLPPPQATRPRLARVPLQRPDGVVHENQPQQRRTMSDESSDPVLPSVDWENFIENIIKKNMREMQEASVPLVKQIQFIRRYMSCAWPTDDREGLPRDQEMVTSALARAAAEVFSGSGSPDPALDDSMDSMVTASTITEVECTLTNDQLLCVLQSAHQCGREDCVDADCIKGQDLLKQLSSSLHEERANWAPHILQTLRLLFRHGCKCGSQSTCTVPYCTFFHKHSSQDTDAAINMLHRILLRGLEGDIERPTTNDILHQITHEPPHVPMAASHGMPEQGITYRIVLPKRLFDPSDDFLATPTIQPGEYWNIRRMPHRILSVLVELRRPQHNVIQNLWAIQNPRDLVVFQVFAGNSLDEYIQYQYSNGAPLELTWIILEHVLLGTEYLQGQNILFMNWHGHAITVDMTRACLTDFSRAIHMTSDHLHGDQIQNCLMAMNPFVIAPEMFNNNVFLSSTDSWGVGLIGHLVSTGRMLNHRFRHMPPDQARLNVRTSPIVNRPLLDNPRLMRFFELCLQVDPNQRQPIRGLLLFVQKSRQLLDETNQQDKQR